MARAKKTVALQRAKAILTQGPEVPPAPTVSLEAISQPTLGRTVYYRLGEQFAAAGETRAAVVTSIAPGNPFCVGLLVHLDLERDAEARDPFAATCHVGYVNHAADLTTLHTWRWPDRS